MTVDYYNTGTRRKMKSRLQVLDHEISIQTKDGIEYISITDIARHKNPDQPDVIIGNWLRNRNTIEFLGMWEQLNNPEFKPVEFDGFKKEAGLNSFTLTPNQWIEATKAIGLQSRPGRYGGTYAHKDIAFEFATWISAEFKLFLIANNGLEQSERLTRLNQIAISQMKDPASDHWPVRLEKDSSK